MVLNLQFTLLSGWAGRKLAMECLLASYLHAYAG